MVGETRSIGVLTRVSQALLVLVCLSQPFTVRTPNAKLQTKTQAAGNSHMHDLLQSMKAKATASAAAAEDAEESNNIRRAVVVRVAAEDAIGGSSELRAAEERAQSGHCVPLRQLREQGSPRGGKKEQRRRQR